MNVARNLVRGNPARLVYGTMAVGIVLAAEDSHETYDQTIGAVAITLVLYWLAHSYAELTGRRLQGKTRLGVRPFVRAAVHEAPLLVGGALPVAVLVAFWIAGGSLDHALTGAVWAVVASLILIEWTAAKRERLVGLDIVRQTVVGAALGMLIVAVKAILH